MKLHANRSSTTEVPLIFRIKPNPAAALTLRVPLLSAYRRLEFQSNGQDPRPAFRKLEGSVPLVLSRFDTVHEAMSPPDTDTKQFDHPYLQPVANYRCRRYLKRV